MMALAGLSPLARGTLERYFQSLMINRFIPAGAGNTSSVGSPRLRQPVYPRWRGEHSDNQHHARAQCGLSPLARGTQCVQILPALEKRFIPAGAGNTIPSAYAPAPPPVYPRWRGEHLTSRARTGSPPGLSPLARGTLERLRRRAPKVRFIPAGAGNTRDELQTEVAAAVYPRWRGEHQKSILSRSDAIGLSPLARGTRIMN